MFSVGLDKLLFFILFSQAKLKRSDKASIENKNNKIKEILFGSLLGDGKLEMAPRAINARFGFIQSEKNKDSFLFLLNELTLLGTIKYREYSYTDIRTGKIYKSLNF